MKKLMGLMLALMLLVGCSNGGSNGQAGGNQAASLESMSAEEQYKYAVDAMKDVTSMEANMLVNMVMSYNEETLPQETSVNMKMNNVQDINKMEAELIMNAMGTEMTMYISGGYIYMDSMGMKIKTVLTDDVVATSVGQTELNEYDPNTMTNLVSTRSGDDYVLSFDMSEAALQEYMGAELEALQEQVPGAEFTYNKAGGSMTIDKDGMPKQVTIDMDVDMGVDGDAIKLVMTMTIDYKNLNSTTVTLPEDIEEYKEY